MTAIVNSFRGFAHEHDEIPAFHAAFLVGTILCAAVFNLGFYLLLILGHVALDFVKYHEVHGMSWGRTLKAAALESIGDIALFLTALTFAVYLNHTYMLSAIGGLMRAELTVIKAFGTILPKIRILENICAIALNFHGYLHTQHPALDRKFTRLEKWSLRTIVVSSILLVMAILLFQVNHWDLLAILEHELIPGIY
ncbi:MAG: hypothetical protein KBC47_04185 [Candidatus Peribacteraceae bacterium]|nr:hypothetical protein [Candidatus Peribacteraceae bacterium]